MKIFLCIESRHDKILDISGTLRRMGHEVHIYITNSYHSECTYWQKKIDELGIHGGSNDYSTKWKTKFINDLISLKPDRCVCVNTLLDVLPNNEDRKNVEQILKDNNVYTIAWMVDPIDTTIESLKGYEFYDKVYSYEKRDVNKLNSIGIDAEYLPVGYQRVYATDNHKRHRDYDVCFVGSPYKYRIKLLEKVAKQASLKKWKLKIAGPFWENLYIWKKFMLAVRYPYLYRYIDNGNLNSSEVADIYRNSKICLNVHVGGAKSCNPRTFEILATGALQMVDSREYYDLLIPNEDFIVYDNIDDLIELIDIYIKKEE